MSTRYKKSSYKKSVQRQWPKVAAILAWVSMALTSVKKAEKTNNQVHLGQATAMFRSVPYFKPKSHLEHIISLD